MKKSELRQIIKEEIKSLLKEVDSKLELIAKIAEKKSLVSMRPELEKIFNKKLIDFSFEPVPHFRIKDKGKTILIVNKKYVDKSEIIVKDIAIGYE